MMDLSDQSATVLSDFVVVANRLPVDMVERSDGTTTWRRSPGGLVTALEPVLRRRNGCWVGWPGVSDRDVDPFVHDGLRVRPVRLDAPDVEGFYEGFSNSTLWPLYHDVVVKPTFDRHWWAVYRDVNRRFAHAAASAAAPGATVWVHDYQLQLVPQMLRELRPDVTIGFFLHIPFPPVELFAQLPWRRNVMEGMLGADLVGFHLPGGAQNFVVLARRMLGLETAQAGAGRGEVRHEGRTVRVGAFPISIDAADMVERARSESVRRRSQEIREDLGNPDHILLGVDRLDYTKGIDLRLDAVGELYDEGRLDPSRTVMVQLATPSREQVEQYALMRNSIETQVGRINGDHGQLGHPTVHYLYQPVDRDELIALYVAADVMLVTPLRDGMNLVAKEYVACHPDHDGALVLSEFTGAASELRRAHLVNPHDLDLVKNTIVAALEQSDEERRNRMAALHAQVTTNDVHRWAQTFLDTLAATSEQAPPRGREDASPAWQIPSTAPFSSKESRLDATAAGRLSTLPPYEPDPTPS
ncbi:alpha,alpha-trehalose-phosphate synthase (UDP-forming) [Rhodococcus spongiicola]|uniref:alpha,alpha-trehalose-phosphate synthase (ADP-forming) n=1 Tax=Rhodococcus spongiicola TaxID=2487352 RepID=A0A438B652_9NOCA|nr:trehalose-6-phosphate synthase [Rhodococcus spongiicola]RVW06435.1 trehalose-6-phosphate synthase [Rhodococcus spongiicola]